MSKKVTTQPTGNARNTLNSLGKTISIIAIVLVAVIILSVALALILKSDVKSPASNNPADSNSSTLAIKNGDFEYSSSDDTGYPKTALNWSKYAYKDGSSFQSIETNEKSVMGIIDLDDWDNVRADLDSEDVTFKDATYVPKAHVETTDDDNNHIYMIHNREATTASILSDSASVASGASVKITVWLNISQVTSGKVVIMIQKSNVSAKAEDWYAYDFAIIDVDEEKVDENGWMSHEFWIFNREASTKYIRCSVGLGNVYTTDENKEIQTATGTLFVDDITYETVTANEYREQVDSYTGDEEAEKIAKPFQIIENEDITDESKYLELKEENTGSIKLESFDDSETFVSAAGGVSPFTVRDDFSKDGFKIYKFSELDSSKAMALRLESEIQMTYNKVDKDHIHISFWVRVDQVDAHKATKANIYLQKKNAEGNWEDVDNGSFENIVTSQEIEKDTNCGWVKYDIYLKPATVTTTDISILFVLGNKDGYKSDDDGMIPRGNLYVTSPAYEQISYKDYNNASSGTYVKKINLVGSSASTSVTNGSFSDANNLGTEPTNWSPVFGGDNAIYKDGKGNAMSSEQRAASLVQGSGITTIDEGTVDDAQKQVLKITNNSATRFGYITDSISLSARTVYVFSVLAKTDGQLKPYIYLIDNSKVDEEGYERADAIVARIEGTNENYKTLDEYFDYPLSLGQETDNNGWVRYYFVMITNNESSSIRIALFNGSIDNAEDTQEGTVYYDNVKMKAIGSYSVSDEQNEAKTHYLVKFTANSGYEDAFEDLIGKDLEKEYTDIFNSESEIAKTLGDSLIKPEEADFEELSLIPEDTDDSDGDTDSTTTETRDVDWGLLMSVISSVALVAALLIVFVIKLFQKKRPRAV